MNSLLLFMALIAGTVIFSFLTKKPYYSLAVYYFVNFCRSTFLGWIQVRYQILLQLFVIFFCMFASFVSDRKQNQNRTIKRKISVIEFENARLLVGIVLVFECTVGIIDGYSIFQIAVDAYKVLEIFVFYYFLRCTWRATWQIEKCIYIILGEMCIFGVIEAFTTERGSIAINIMMSFFPLVFAAGFYEKIKHYWLWIIMAIFVLLTSKTRTYMLGTIVGILIVLAHANGCNSKKIRTRGLFLLIFTVVLGEIYMTLFGNPYIDALFSRIMELGNGFEASGGYRIYEIDKAIEKFLESPLFGKGYGYLEYVYIELMGWFEWGDFMHNTYVEILAKTGLLGSFLYGIGLLSYLRNQRTYIRKSQYTDNNSATGMLIGGFAGTCCWLVTYFAAPLSSYGYVFLPGIVGLLYYNYYKIESKRGVRCL